MRKTGWLAFVLMMVVLLAVVALAGCGNDEADETAENGTSVSEGTGTLIFTANGEDFAREGFTSKDGWNINLERLYVTLGNITAYQTDPPYDTEQGWDIGYQEKVELDDTYTVNLTNPAADPLVVDEYDNAPAGHYNALSWDMLRAEQGDPEGYAIVFEGTAEKDGQTIEFTLKLEQETACLGGDYIGDERKGILEADGEADLEMTFHVDHFFGSGEEDADDPLNLDALGFDPLAALAVDGVVDVDLATLKGALSAEDYSKLEAILLHFGHVGEGHVLSKPLQ